LTDGWRLSPDTHHRDKVFFEDHFKDPRTEISERKRQHEERYSGGEANYLPKTVGG
jgi:hypothetical protein